MIPYWSLSDNSPDHLLGGVESLIGPDIHEEQSPCSDGSDLIDTNCWDISSSLCAWSLFKELFPFGLSVAAGGLVSDMSASTLKGRQDTWAVRLFSRGPCTSSSVEHSSLQSPGEDMLRFGGQRSISNSSPENTSLLFHEVQTCSVHGGENFRVTSSHKVDNFLAGKTLGGTWTFSQWSHARRKTIGSL